MRTTAKLLLILLYLLTGASGIAERLQSLGLSPGLPIYLGLFGLLALALVAAAFTRPWTLRWGLATLLCAAAFYLDSYEAITREPMSYDAFINMWNSAASAPDAVDQHAGALAGTLARSVLLFAGLVLQPQGSLRFGRLAPAAPVAGVLLLAGILFARGGEGGTGLPGPFTPLAYSGLFLYERLAEGTPHREPVALRPARPPSGDIVLIVDESVAGNYLDLNSPNGARSGLLQPRPGVAVHDFGLAASITNCSVGSNVTLRHGGTRADYRRINATMPSIFDYAKAAGLTTVYLDAQGTGGRLQNLMDAQERRQIDRFVQFDRVPVRDRDMAVADTLAASLRNDTPEFVLINKVGAHFPVHDKYPDAYMRHRPALARGRYVGISDTGDRTGFGGTAAEWVRYRNAYRNTLDWNVGAFFDRVLDRVDLSRATLIYTSDHGQDLHETGSPGSNTHCSGDPVPQEGLVPLVVIDSGAPATSPWVRAVAANRNRMSHYRIFPTLLALMGYPEPAVRRLYGDALTASAADPFTFNTRFNARLGLDPRWEKIDLRRIPPAPRDTK
ncbi:sulfatase-like hydrolase/transferase [Sphingomonas desiccabilis]|uniref:Sulfatase n=1 Tax=Sphingomonas desiccabilis TaxID=429134 RepID=A0A4Q2J0E3_9SPHN|nr:sulfatase-like hydrolase/transferase [Sphingomonas desiccabilis]MBB3910046.1 lipid A ethanolaminephosphotransferase [Sphingomonas desiccabilis]RXZ34742.1 sulfatase [Sphingomonas desiccabilis]